MQAMSAAFPRCFRLFAALVLAVIGLQATPSQAVPIVVQHGSAFSASTSEVAVLIRRDSENEKRAVVKLPGLRPQAARPAVRRFAPIVQLWPDNRQTGPPALARPPRSPAAPRAPPILS